MIMFVLYDYIPTFLYSLRRMVFESEIWGPHYWFFLHTVSHSYPQYPNSVTKRKYYDLISNMPVFIPNSEMGDKFSTILDKYPVSPYLDNRDSFIRWVHFIHNKFNEMVGKEELSLHAGIDKYLSEYKVKPVYLSESIRFKSHIIHLIFILLCFLLIYAVYE